MHGIAVFANLQGAFDALGRKGALYKLHKAGVTNNLLSFSSSFLTDGFTPVTGLSPALVFLRDLFLSPFILLVFTADMALEEPKQTPEIPTASKYADNFEFWRIGTDFYHLLIQTQIAIINLQTWCLKWQISINISKTNYVMFYGKKNSHHHPPFW